MKSLVPSGPHRYIYYYVVPRLVLSLITPIDGRHRAYRASLLFPYLTFRSDLPRSRPGMEHSHSRQNRLPVRNLPLRVSVAWVCNCAEWP